MKGLDYREASLFQNFAKSYVAETRMCTVPFNIRNFPLKLYIEKRSKCLSDTG